VSRLGLGLAALGPPGYINVAAYDGGVRYFDAARSYGKAEAFLASWLEQRRLPPGAATVGSKMGIHVHLRVAGRCKAARGQGPCAAI
jgi:aryl-alcohol dehydrogenase-like predicted oxidoreductase